MSRFATLARAFANAFTTSHRPDGEMFVRLIDDAPDWMGDAVRNAHDGELPDDWRYATCSALVDRIADDAEGGTRRDDIDTGEMADGLADAYNNALLDWLRADLSRASYADDCSETTDIFRLIGLAQYECIRQMADGLLSAIAAAEGEEG